MKTLAAILLALTTATAIAGEIVTGKVVSITDGDTLRVRTDGEQTLKIRLHGIDTP